MSCHRYRGHGGIYAMAVSDEKIQLFCEHKERSGSGTKWLYFGRTKYIKERGKQ